MTFVLVVDDETAVLRALAINFRAHGYDVESAQDGRTALQIIDERMPDVVLLDLGLPDISGIAVLRQIRSFSQVPVIVVSARSDSEDKVEALDLGADDYVTKPFSIQELLARVRSATRRGVTGAEEPVIQVGNLLIDIADSQATRDGELVHLTPTEWRIVAVLVRNRGRLVRQLDLLHEIWGPGYERETNYLRVHLTSIRRKLEPHPGRQTLFVTEPGLGYRFNPGEETGRDDST